MEMEFNQSITLVPTKLDIVHIVLCLVLYTICCLLYKLMEN